MRQVYYNETMISRGNLDAGRVLQKKRTRKALLEAAGRLIEQGERPRLAAVAREAMVSRATVYRYFPSEEALVIEAPLALAFQDPEEVIPDDAPRDPGERAAMVQRYLFDHAAGNENQFRTFLRATLDQWIAAQGDLDEPLRAGRRNDMYEHALAPVRDRLDDETYDRVRHALSVMSGIESLLVIRDVCGLTAERGAEIMEWAVRRLVRAVIDDAEKRSEPTAP